MPIYYDYNGDHCEALKAREDKPSKMNAVFKESIIIPIGSPLVVQ